MMHLFLFFREFLQLVKLLKIFECNPVIKIKMEEIIEQQEFEPFSVLHAQLLSLLLSSFCSE